MSDENKKYFDVLAPGMKERIKTLPSLFMAENRPNGRYDDEQIVIYGFVSDIEIYESDLKIYYSGYRKDIPQQRINDLHEELGIPVHKVS